MGAEGGEVGTGFWMRSPAQTPDSLFPAACSTCSCGLVLPDSQVCAYMYVHDHVCSHHYAGEHTCTHVNTQVQITIHIPMCTCYMCVHIHACLYECVFSRGSLWVLVRTAPCVGP